jgi:hypothetical protein
LLNHMTYSTNYNTVCTVCILEKSIKNSANAY